MIVMKNKALPTKFILTKDAPTAQCLTDLGFTPVMVYDNTYVFVNDPDTPMAGITKSKIIFSNILDF